MVISARKFILPLFLPLFFVFGIVSAKNTLQVVGVLGNTSGMSDMPVPYAFYTGLGMDAQGRLYLAGSDQGIPVCDQNGACLSVLPVPKQGVVRSLMATAEKGKYIFFIAQNVSQNYNALCRINTSAKNAAKLRVESIAEGTDMRVISPALDSEARIIVGQADIGNLKYTVTAYSPASGKGTVVFTIDMPKGVTQPWRHLIQADPDNAFSIVYSGGVNWTGRYNLKGERIGEAMEGQIIDGFRYIFGYEGGLRRTDITGTKSMPGDCGSVLQELRMPCQMIRSGERYFFAGRGGIAEAKWNGTNFEYQRRIGGIYIEEMVDADTCLQGVAYTSQGHADVQHPVEIPKTQPIGQILQETWPLHGRNVATFVRAPYGRVYVYRNQKGANVCYIGPEHLAFDISLPEVQEIGQAAVLDKDLLIADPKSGTIWHRPLMDKSATVTPWHSGLSGVIGVCVSPDAVFAAAADQVSCLSRDGLRTVWTSEETYQGIRRLACYPPYVYVCDTAGNIVDQLDAVTGKRLARLGVTGEAGSSLTRLNRPYAVAADPNGVYIADNGNGRVVIATTTLWRPEIPSLKREDNSPVSAVEIPVKPPKPGRMSVNIYDKKDVTVRQLVCAQPSAKSVIWDGRDMYGNWVKPGVYRYHGIIAPKFQLRYVTSISQSGNPPYRTADGKGSWGGVWGNVMDICPVTSAPDSDILVLWGFEEGEGGLIRMSQDGEVKWKQHLDWWMKANQTAVACDGENVYIACASAINAPEGQSDYGGEYRRPMLWRVDAETGAKRLYMPNAQPQPMFGEYSKEKRVVTDLACHDGKLYFTSPVQNMIFVADAQTGQQVDSLHLNNASGIAFDKKGNLFAGSGSKIVSIDPLTRISTVIADAGGEIWDLDILPDKGFVISVGAPRHQVVYFDLTGKEIQSPGHPGGRPLIGKMIPDSFLAPTGLCVAGNGKVFVAEDSVPRRFTRWSQDAGLEKEFHGPYYYSGMFGVDDEHPEYVYADTHGSIIRYKVDYTTGKWEVDRYWTGVYEPVAESLNDPHGPAKWWPRIRHKDGKTYWCSGSGAIVELRDDSFRYVAAVYGGWVEKLPDGNYKPMYHTKNTGLKGAWSDINSDGEKQPEEWQVTDKPAYPVTSAGPQQGWGAYFDEKFDLYMHDWSDTAEGGIWEIPVAEWKNNTPVYRWDLAGHVGLPRGHGLEHGASGVRTAFACGDGVYGFNGGYNAAGLPGVGHGHDWEFAQVTKYDQKTGKPVWHAGQRCASFVAPGEHYCPTGAAGIIGDYLFWTDENSLVHVWDVKHGLYVDTLLEDPSRGPVPSAYTVWVELFNTRVFRHPGTGKVYLMAASDAIHIFEIIGVEQPVLRFEGNFSVTAKGLERARQQVASRAIETERSLEIGQASGTVKIDGDLSEFGQSQTATMALNPTAKASARLLYDEKYLYVAYEVSDDSPWKNSGTDITTLFKTGDTVDVWFGPAGRHEPGIGDVRVLFAPSGKDNIAVAFRPKEEKDARPVPFRSPSGEVILDKVEVLKDAVIAVKTTSTGYNLEVAIPRAEIGLQENTDRIGVDLSVNFSDPAGQRNVACLHWARNSATIVYDLPTEAGFQPDTWGTGILKK